MLPAMAELILGVDQGLLKTCQQFIQETWCHTKALSIITTAKRSIRFHQDVLETMNRYSQHSPQLGVVAEIYSTAATWADVNDMVSHQ